jgi:uncharacterized membrane protein YbhN (UPF0104 family)
MKKILKTIALVAAVTLASLALCKMGSQIVGILSKVNWLLIVVAVIGLTIYQWLNAGTWKDVFSSLGINVSRSATTRVWIQSESMKWLPGGIWGYGSRVVNARKLGTDIPTASAALAIELTLTVLAWGIIALSIIPTAIGQDLVTRALALASQSVVLTISAIAIAMVAGFSLISIHKVRAALGKILRRFIPSMDGLKLQPRSLARALIIYLGLCLLNGLLLWIVTLAVPGLLVPWNHIIGIGGVAWLVGFFAIGIPGGIGVREATLAGLLVWYGQMESAIAAAVVFRAAQVAAELIVLGISFLIGWRISRNSLAVRPSIVLN